MYRMRFPDSVSLEKKTGKNASHKVTYGTLVTLKCNYQAVTQEIDANSGKEIISAAWIAFPPGTDIDFDDRITLPDGTQPPITSITDRRNDITKKVVYVEVYLSKSQNPGSGI